MGDMLSKGFPESANGNFISIYYSDVTVQFFVSRTSFWVRCSLRTVAFPAWTNLMEQNGS